MEVVVFDIKNNKIVKWIRNIVSIGVHRKFTFLSYRNENCEHEVEIILHSPDIYILKI